MSGTRLKAMYFLGSDSSKIYERNALFDSLLQSACAYGLAADGALRCLPTVQPTAKNAPVFYSDNQCTQLIAWVEGPPSGCPSNLPKYVYAYELPGTCPSVDGAYPAHVYPVQGNVVPNAVNYKLTSSGCQTAGVAYPSLIAVTLNAELAAASFVAGTPGIDP